MTIWEAYDRYKIMPNLRLHQMRVAAVARTLALALGIHHETVTRAGLVHDMGNIMKSDMSQFPEAFYAPEGRAYWENVKKDMGARFGTDEHSATGAILRDLGMDAEIIALISGMGFSKAEAIAAHGSPELRVLEYADQRVGPYGIVSMQERLHEGHERYKNRIRTEYGSNDTVFNKNRDILLSMERELFTHLPIRPESLTEHALKGTIESLRDYRIID
jgi:putative nucleotidyltransferase with HDIG domain